MDFISANGQAASANLGPTDSGPLLYSESNRTSAIDDIRSVVLYVFIVTIFIGFFLILPGIRNEKFPTFLCITSSLVVTSIILIALFGTTWHVSEAPISAAYKAFSQDRIQGELSVRIGLQSVNITLRAQKYYILHSTYGPMLMDGSPGSGTSGNSSTNSNNNNSNNNTLSANGQRDSQDVKVTKSSGDEQQSKTNAAKHWNTSVIGDQQYTVKRVNIDINYNERFYWIEPNQMRQEHHHALERGLPFPILTVMEYLSQDEGGFSWSRQYRLAGYYSSMMLWLSLCLCCLMFILHCAAPKYGIYTMQVLGFLLLLTNLAYATLVPRGEQKLVIPFEGQSLSFKFGWNFWLVLIGGCLSLTVGTIIVIIDTLFPNFIFITILDVDYDARVRYARERKRRKAREGSDSNSLASSSSGRQTELSHNHHVRPSMPPFLESLKT